MSMRIIGLGAALPSREESNAERVQRLLDANLHLSEKTRSGLRRTAQALLALSGASSRRVCAEGETGWSLARAAGLEALAQAGLPGDALDVVISAGVSRGMLEPAMAAPFAAALGAHRALCFDVTEACMGWLRAVWLASHLLDAGSAQRILIVTCEVNSGYEALRLEAPEQELPHTLPQLTIGEAAAAVVLARDGRGGAQPWRFWFRSAPEGHGLCRLTLPGSEKFLPPGATEDPWRFYCHFQEMNRFTFEHFEGEYARFLAWIRGEGLAIQHVLTHASEYSGWRAWAERSGLQTQFRSVYPTYGNVVTASVPLGLALLDREGVLHPGDGIYVYVASSGMGVGGAYWRF